MDNKRAAQELDNFCLMIPLEINPSSVVYIQGVFETYEGIGIVRTIDAMTGKIAILTTKDLLDQCLSVLKDIGEEINLKFVKLFSKELQKKYLGYYKEKYQKC